jgi:hypothetical protein
VAAQRELLAASVRTERVPATEPPSRPFESIEPDFGSWWGLVVVLGDIAQRVERGQGKDGKGDEPQVESEL